MFITFSRHVTFLRDNGFNSVRLGIMWAGVEPIRGQYDESYLLSIKQTVNLLCQHGECFRQFNDIFLMLEYDTLNDYLWMAKALIRPDLINLNLKGSHISLWIKPLIHWSSILETDSLLLFSFRSGFCFIIQVRIKYTQWFYYHFHLI